MFTIILPHKRNAGNNDALAICLDCIQRNTVHDFTLLIDAATNAPLYPRINAMVQAAPTDWVIYLASDMFVAPRWDVPIVEAMQDDRFVTAIVVEPGVMSVSPNNYAKDFGKSPAHFNRAAFEDWTQSDEAPAPKDEGWVVPVMFSRKRFAALGGLVAYSYQDDRGFTNADELLFQRHKEGGGEVIQVKSYCYHMQRYSEVYSQELEARK